MSGLARILKHNLNFGGGNGTFVQDPFWTSDDRASHFGFSSSASDEERIESSFEDYVTKAFKANGIVFACVTARQFPFSEALFRYQDMTSGEPGELSYKPALDSLRDHISTGNLLSRMEQDGSLAGNSYWTPRDDGVLRRLRPDWVTIVSGVRGESDGDPYDIDAEILGYIYHPTVRNQRGVRPDPVFLTPARVAHYAPVPDPLSQWRGTSWLMSVLSEIQGDQAITSHKRQFFQNGATSNFVVTYDANLSPENFQEYVKLFERAHSGPGRAYKTIHLGGGADAKSTGADLKQLDFAAVQAGGETRIAAAAGVGSIIGRLTAGMQGASLNDGNYVAAKRQYADMTLRPLWRTAASCLEKFAKVPAGKRLWYADKHIDFLQEDAKDNATIMQLMASTARTLVDGGYKADSVSLYLASGDPKKLVHSGLVSVQQQAPGSLTADPAPTEEKSAHYIDTDSTEIVL